MPKYEKLHRAVSFATEQHFGQDRKYLEIPYIEHPLQVMTIVRTVSDVEDMLCAAVLHDVVEDTPATIENVRELFGDRTAELVDWLTDCSTPDDGNRSQRKKIDRKHSASAPADAQTIKLADLIHNTQSIVAHDAHFARVYMKEKERLLEVLTQGDSRLYQQAQTALASYQQSLLDEALRNG